MPQITGLDARVVSYGFETRPEPLAVGSALRRDVVLVRVTCEDGTVGYGEAFHGHAGTAVAEIVTLGFQPQEELAAEVRRLITDFGTPAVKLRIGDSPQHDLARVRHIREAFGDELGIMVDANLGHRYEVAAVAPALGELGVRWLEEPYPPASPDRFAALRARGLVPVAGGENLGSAYEFADWIGRGALDVVQPDVSRVGGITEALRIAALAHAAGLRFAPHISHSALNHAATLHVLSASGADGVYELDASAKNPFRDRVFSSGAVLSGGRARLLAEPGLGVQVDEPALADYPAERGSPFPRVWNE